MKGLSNAGSCENPHNAPARVRDKDNFSIHEFPKLKISQKVQKSSTEV